MNERERKLISLRKAHNKAIDHYDYAEAESIQNEIWRIQAEDPEEEVRRRTLQLQFDNVQAQFDLEAKHTDSETSKVISRYRRRYAELEATHKEQLQTFEQEYQTAIEREHTRPMPEVERILIKSKMFAKDHHYDVAQETFQEALVRRDELLAERLAACHNTFRDQKEQLLMRQARDLTVLKNALKAALRKVTLDHKFQEKVLSNKIRVKEFKAGVWPPERYSVGAFHRGAELRPTQQPRRRARTPRRKYRPLPSRLDPTQRFSP